MRYFIAMLMGLFWLTILGAQVENNKQAKDVWKAPKTADELKNPVKGKESAIPDGKKVYIQNCMSCHGKEGIGDGPQGANLKPKPANLRSKLVQEQTDGALFWKITNGRGAMVPWKFTLSEKQRWNLVEYIREFGKKK